MPSEGEQYDISTEAFRQGYIISRQLAELLQNQQQAQWVNQTQRIIQPPWVPQMIAQAAESLRAQLGQSSGLGGVAAFDYLEYWREHMPTDASVPLMALMPRTCRTYLEARDFKSKLVCVSRDRISYQFTEAPFAGMVFDINLGMMPWDVVNNIEWVQLQIKEALEAEWINYRSEWRITPEGAVRLSEADRAFAQEQARFEQAPPEERAGLLGP